MTDADASQRWQAFRNKGGVHAVCDGHFGSKKSVKQIFRQEEPEAIADEKPFTDSFFKLST